MGLKLLNVPQIRTELGYGTGLRGGGISGSICGDLDRAEKNGGYGVEETQWKEGDTGGCLLNDARFITLSLLNGVQETILLDVWFSTLDIH